MANAGNAKGVNENLPYSFGGFHSNNYLITLVGSLNDHYQEILLIKSVGFNTLYKQAFNKC